MSQKREWGFIGYEIVQRVRVDRSMVENEWLWIKFLSRKRKREKTNKIGIIFVNVTQEEQSFLVLKIKQKSGGPL